MKLVLKACPVFTVDPDVSDMYHIGYGGFLIRSTHKVKKKMRSYSPYGTKINFVTVYLPTYNGYEIYSVRS
jgi:hypothetical protein